MTEDPLGRVLAESRVRCLQDLLLAHDERALAAQRVYRRFSVLFIVAMALASASGALILYGAGTEEAAAADPTLQHWLAGDTVRLALFIVEVAALAAAAFAAEMRREQGNSAEWLAERRAAERCRTELFDQIIEVAAGVDQETQRAAFEHFEREQLRGQIGYYARAEARHKRSASRSAAIGAALAALIAATGASGIGGEAWIAVAAFVGVLTPVALSALRAWREDTLDREKAEHYRAVWAQLKRLEGQTDEVRRALEGGDFAPARTFVARVHDVMRGEHGAWTPAGDPA